MMLKMAEYQRFLGQNKRGHLFEYINGAEGGGENLKGVKASP
jgi:hypothetical protein